MATETSKKGSVMNKRRILVLLTVLLVSVLSTDFAGAQPPWISYQGRLLKNGSPYTGVADLKAAIVEGETVLWSNDGTLFGEPGTPFPVEVDNGSFSFLIGDPNHGMMPITSIELMSAAQPSIRLWVNTGGGFEQLTDQPMASSPFAMRCESAQWALSNFVVYGQLGVKTTSGPQSDFHVNGDARFDLGGGQFLFTTPGGMPGLVMYAVNGHRRDLVADATGIQLLVGSSSAQPTAGSGITIDEQGNVGIGTGSPARRLDIDGTTRTGVLEITGGADLSEGFTITESGLGVEPGMVVCIDPEHPGNLTVSKVPYSRTVAGIVSGAGGVQPGMVMGQEGTEADGPHPVALSGRVWTKALATNGPIEPGDLLTTSDRPGHAMKVTDLAAAQGAILGKAMTALDEGTGLVLVLVTLQ
jgi:hypothetical protein